MMHRKLQIVTAGISMDFSLPNVSVDYGETHILAPVFYCTAFFAFCSYPEGSPGFISVKATSRAIITGA